MLGLGRISCAGVGNTPISKRWQQCTCAAEPSPKSIVLLKGQVAFLYNLWYTRVGCGGWGAVRVVSSLRPFSFFLLLVIYVAGKQKRGRVTTVSTVESCVANLLSRPEDLIDWSVNCCVGGDGVHHLARSFNMSILNTTSLVLALLLSAGFYINSILFVTDGGCSTLYPSSSVLSLRKYQNLLSVISTTL